MSTTRPPAYDERFATPIDASRRGAHRARPKPVSAGLPVLAGIAVVLVVIGGVYTVLGGSRGSDKAATVSTAGPSASAATQPTTKASSGSTPTSVPTTPADTASATGSAGSSGGTVDRSVSLKVLNSLGVQGLARKVEAKLAPDGWTIASTGNSINRDLATTRVYYGSSSLKATAKAMVQDLGYGSPVKDSSVAPQGIVVVLGQDAE